MSGGISIPRPQTQVVPNRSIVFRRTITRTNSMNSSLNLNKTLNRTGNAQSFKTLDFPVFPKSKQKSIFINNLDLSTIQKLHKAKCADLRIHERPDQLKRFQQYIEKHFDNRCIDLRLLGIGRNVV